MRGESISRKNNLHDEVSSKFHEQFSHLLFTKPPLISLNFSNSYATADYNSPICLHLQWQKLFSKWRNKLFKFFPLFPSPSAEAFIKSTSSKKGFKQSSTHHRYEHRNGACAWKKFLICSLFVWRIIIIREALDERSIVVGKNGSSCCSNYSKSNYELISERELILNASTLAGEVSETRRSCLFSHISIIKSHFSSI